MKTVKWHKNCIYLYDSKAEACVGDPKNKQHKNYFYMRISV